MINYGSIIRIRKIDYLLGKFILNNKDYACLFSISDGNRYVDPILVESFHHISEKELNSMCVKDGFEIIKKG